MEEREGDEISIMMRADEVEGAKMKMQAMARCVRIHMRYERQCTAK